MPHAPTTRRCPGTRGATRPVLLLALLVGLLLPAAGATALSSGPLVVDRGATLALPMPDFFGSLQDTDVQVDGILRLPFGLRVFPMSGGSAEGADAFIPYVGSFEHEGTTIGFTRGDDRIEFRDPVVDTDTLGFFADVAIFQDGSFLEIRDERRVFDLSPLFPTLPSLPFPLPGGVAGLPGLPESLPAVVDLFGHDLLVIPGHPALHRGAGCSDGSDRRFAQQIHCYVGKCYRG